MTRNLLKISLAAILFALVVIGFSACSSEQKASSKTENVDESGKPKFTLKSLENADVSLADYRGKVVLVNIWATWCMPCVHEIPDLVKLRNTYRNKGFEVLGLVVQSPEKNVHQMVKKLNIDYPVLWADNASVAKLGKIRAIPRTFIFDADGNIVEDLEGMRDYATFEQLIKKHL